MTVYRNLSANTLGSAVGFLRPLQSMTASVTVESPALDVMTDLGRTGAVTTSAHALANS